MSSDTVAKKLTMFLWVKYLELTAETHLDPSLAHCLVFSKCSISVYHYSKKNLEEQDIHAFETTEVLLRTHKTRGHTCTQLGICKVQVTVGRVICRVNGFSNGGDML